MEKKKKPQKINKIVKYKNKKETPKDWLRLFLSLI